MELVFQHEEAQLWYDTEQRVLKAVWFGQVSIEAFQGLVNKGSEILEEAESAHMMFDRRKLSNFSTEARIWFKHDFMKRGGTGRRLIRKVRRIAAIKSSSAIGQIVSTVFSKVLLIFNPKLEYCTFENEYEADFWLKTRPLNGKTQTVSIQRGFFSRLFRRAS